MRDLLGKSANLKFEDILKSRTSGSIKARLGKSLIEVFSDNGPFAPKKIIFKPTDPVIFPQRIKSSITIDVKDINDEIKDLILNEEDELISEFEKNATIESEAPLAVKDDKKSE